MHRILVLPHDLYNQMAHKPTPPASNELPWLQIRVVHPSQDGKLDFN